MSDGCDASDMFKVYDDANDCDFEFDFETVTRIKKSELIADEEKAD